MAGRPTKLTPDVHTLIVQAISIGTTRVRACQYAGITQTTFNEWLVRGDEGEDPYAAFALDVEKAEGAAVVGWLAKIENAASAGHWQAAAWKLERRYPQEYGRTIQEQKHTGQVVHAHAWIERLQAAHNELDAKRVKQLEAPHDA